MTWTNNGSTTTPTQRDIKGPKGDKGDTGDTGARGATGSTGSTGSPGAKGDPGAPGLTTSITVNGSTYTQSGGKITLPNYVLASGVHLQEV